MSVTRIKYKRLKKQKRRNIILNMVCIIIACSGITWTANYFWKYIKYEVTNDAMVDQYIAPVNIRVAGYIQEVKFKEHQFVNEGDTLVIIDNREYAIRQKEAKAKLKDAIGSREVLQAGIRINEAKVAEQEANIEEAKAKLWQTEQDFRRYEMLVKRKSVSVQEYDLAKANYEAAKAKLNSIVKQKDAAKSQFDETERRQIGAEAAIQKAEAELDMANLQLSYTVVTAPYSGYMGRRTLEKGQYVSAGQILSYIIKQEGKWITANYRETQIENIYIGQPVRIKVDGIPGKVLNGHVTAISEATGSKYSLVPTDNSAGNFVKVQQRIPVRIDLDETDHIYMDRLRAGMMVETEAVKRR